MTNYEENQIVHIPRPMVGGDGPHSYAQNSSYQEGGVLAAKNLIVQSIIDKLDFRHLHLNDLTTFTVADLGCSTGPGTFSAVKNIIEAVNLKYNSQLENPSPLEFQVFFNDLKDNDFNTLFKTLPYHQNYFAAGVPGSFYTRLFPKSTIHFAHSSYCLHWLSKVPEEIVDSKSPAWNKGSIQCSGLSKEVGDAYLGQYKHDLDGFLNARAEEIVGGGLMVIIIPSRPDGVLMSQISTGLFYELLGRSLYEMAKLGVLSEEKVDSFNLPSYHASPKEMKEIIKANGHFTIERMEKLENDTRTKKLRVDVATRVAFARAALGVLVKEHFAIDDETTDKVFQCLANEVSENLSALAQIEYHLIDVFILLKRN